MIGNRPASYTSKRGLFQKSGAAAFHNYLNTFGPNAPPSSAVIDSDSEEEEDEAGEGEGE